MENQSGEKVPLINNPPIFDRMLTRARAKLLERNNLAADSAIGLVCAINSWARINKVVRKEGDWDKKIFFVNVMIYGLL